VVSVTPRPRFTPRIGPPVPFRQEAGWTSELVWTQRVEEKSFDSAGDRIPVVKSVVTILTELPNSIWEHEMVRNLETLEIIKQRI
jgi:hypothetical protein